MKALQVALNLGLDKKIGSAQIRRVIHLSFMS